jgi:hypothetical protein
MKEKIVYSYNPITFEYIGETIARRSPLDKEEVYLIPAHATEKKPIFVENKITKWNGEDWILEDIPLPPPPPVPTFDEIKRQKLSEIYNARINFQYADLMIDGKAYKSTLNAKNKFYFLLNQRTAAQYPVEWRLADGITWVQLSKDQARQIYNAMQDQENSAYKRETDLIMQVNSATTIDELNSIIIKFE